MNLTILYAILILKPLEIKTMTLEEACRSGHQVIEIQGHAGSCLTINTDGFNNYLSGGIATLIFRPVRCRLEVIPERRWKEEMHEPEKREWKAE